MALSGKVARATNGVNCWLIIFTGRTKKPKIERKSTEGKNCESPKTSVQNPFSRFLENFSLEERIVMGLPPLDIRPFQAQDVNQIRQLVADSKLPLNRRC